tara:strand:- start:159 stop:899 length:741 start_codon:yes stop_codon:yes gene_type:complete
MAFKKNETYMYNPEKEYKLSRSGIDSFINCKRCFYLDKKLNVAKIGMPGFSLNSACDGLMKKELDLYREKGEAHPYMESIDRNMIPFQHEDLEIWRQNFKGLKYHHKETNLIIAGAIDDIWIDVDTEELIVVEYKTTSTSKEISLHDGTKWKEAYRRQIDIYQWLLKMNGFKVSDDSIFLYSNGLKTTDAFDDVLKFETFILEYKGSTDWVESKIKEIKKVLDQKTIPKSDKDCQTCSYVETASSF